MTCPAETICIRLAAIGEATMFVIGVAALVFLILTCMAFVGVVASKRRP